MIIFNRGDLHEIDQNLNSTVDLAASTDLCFIFYPCQLVLSASLALIRGLQIHIWPSAKKLIFFGMIFKKPAWIYEQIDMNRVSFEENRMKTERGNADMTNGSIITVGVIFLKTNKSSVEWGNIGSLGFLV